MSRPTLEQVVAAIADTEPLERACDRLGCDRSTLVSVLLTARSEPAPASIPKAPPATQSASFATPAAVRQRLAERPAVEEPRPVARPGRATLYSDGASRGNPGPAGAGAVLVLGSGQQVRLGRFLGVQTNNVAEYEGVILGLEKALELGVRELDVKADSMLAMMQLRGAWKLKNEGLRPLFAKARELSERLDRVTWSHIPREQNAAADEMSNRAIDERM